MAGRATRRSTIRGDSFNGTRDLSRQDCAALSFPNLATAVDSLIPTHNGGILGLTAAHLSEDNSKIDNFTFHTLGELCIDGPLIFKSSKFFPFTDHQLVVTSIRTGNFFFPGTLTSNLVDHTQIEYFFRRDAAGPPLSLGEAHDLGFRGFSLKFFATPYMERWAKFTILIFPIDKVSILERFAFAEDPRMPGLQFEGGDFQLTPGQNDVLQEADWGQPILPILLSETEVSENSDFPSSNDLRTAMALLLRKARRPEVKKNLDFLTQRWNELSERGAAALKDVNPDTRWPAPRSGWGTNLGSSYLMLSIFLSS